MAKEDELALVNAKNELIGAYSTAHSAFGKFIKAIHASDPKTAAKYLVSIENGGLTLPGAGPPGVTAINGRKRAAAESDEDDSDDDAAAAKKKKGKKVKKEKDPNAPKRPPSAFILFQNAVRKEMKEASPDLHHAELAKQIGDRWRNLAEDAKKPWSEAARKAMEDWNVERKQYEIDHPDVAARSPEDVVMADGEKPKKKRGRPSNAEKAAREAAAKGVEEGVPSNKEKEAKKEKPKKEKEKIPQSKATAPVSASKPKPTSAPPPAATSSSESSVSEDSDSDEDRAPTPAPLPLPVKKAMSPMKKIVQPPVQHSDTSSSDQSESEERPAPPVISKKSKHEKKHKK